ncbi:MAG: hypothetical protein DRQ78_13480 [Epsilonproteobacteria bacterium]|nr:MAG: hypothetical protein DRQ78_13480 [Campylobacterota bacterium]
MKKNFIQFLLFFSLFFNITHASIIAIEDNCHHETTHEYVAEQSQSTECGDLCDIHHLFHFTAILDDTLFTFEPLNVQTSFIQKSILYAPPFSETNIKPPIA